MKLIVLPRVVGGDTLDAAQLRKFTAAVSSVFPQELKDDIYKHLLTSSKGRFDDHLIKTFIIEPPQFVQPSIVCPEFAAGAVRYLYSRYPHCLDDPSSIEYYFTRDAFNVGVQPLDVAIHELNLSISISPPLYDNIQECLEFLPHIRTADNCKLYLFLEHVVEFRLPDLYALFCALKSVVSEFHDHGKRSMSVTWTWCNTLSINVLEHLNLNFAQWRNALLEGLDALHDGEARRLLAKSLGVDGAGLEEKEDHLEDEQQNSWYPFIPEEYRPTTVQQDAEGEDEYLHLIDDLVEPVDAEFMLEATDIDASGDFDDDWSNFDGLDDFEGH